MAQYGKQEYWDSRYQQDTEPFEWYQHWSGFMDTVSPYLNPTQTILIVGCGNSTMSEELYEAGFKSQINVDFSSVAIKQMQEKYQSKVGMQFQSVDIREMNFPDATFSAVLDKGTMDSILCAEGSLILAAKCLSEISRVLRPDGVFVCVSHGHPDIRLQVLEKPEYGWQVSVHNVPKPVLKLLQKHIEEEQNVFHYVYVCRRQN